MKRIPVFLPGLLAMLLFSACGQSEPPLVGLSAPNRVLTVYQDAALEQGAEIINWSMGGDLIQLDESFFSSQSSLIENMGAYRILFIESPSDNSGLMPRFLADCDFSGKIIAPFQAADTMANEPGRIHEMFPEADVREPLILPSNENNQNGDPILEWLADIGLATHISITADEIVLPGILFGNSAATDFAELLPMTTSVSWQPADFAKAFRLSGQLSDTEVRTREYELGGMAYWHEGPAVAIFFSDHAEQTVVPVIPIGKIWEGAEMLASYDGDVTIEAA